MITELVINRPNWLRGEGEENSFLLRERDGKMCCLGFYSLACGLPEHYITGVKNSGQVIRSNAPIPAERVAQFSWLLNFNNNGRCYDNATAGRLMRANDDTKLSPERREQVIIGLFADQGIHVVFTDDPLPERSAQAA